MQLGAALSAIAVGVRVYLLLGTLMVQERRHKPLGNLRTMLPPRSSGASAPPRVYSGAATAAAMTAAASNV
jgi:hypothetical protein